MPEKPCEYCGKPFHVYPYEVDIRRFCSRKCWGLSKRKQIPCICLNCGKTFTKPPSDIALGRGKYCSMECCKTHTVGELAPNWQGGGEERTCANCGQAFMAPNHRIARGGGIYCSKECMDEAGFDMVTCQECGIEFRVVRCRLDVAKFCSRECAALARTKITGPNHPLYDSATRKCAHCGQEFNFHHNSRPNQRYCSRACRDADSAPIPKTCDHCGKTFLVHQYRAQTTRFCSKECRQQFIGPTSIEQLLIDELARRGIPFCFQYEISKWTLDFAFPIHQLAVEADGVYWHSLENVQEKDARKDKDLTDLGWTVLHFDGDEIRESPARCVDLILSRL